MYSELAEEHDHLLGVGRGARPPTWSWLRSVTTCAGLVADLIEKLLEEFDVHNVGLVYSNSSSAALHVEW